MMSTATYHLPPRSVAPERVCGPILDVVGEITGEHWLQVVLVSATLPHDILEMTRKFMTDPIQILVKR